MQCNAPVAHRHDGGCGSGAGLSVLSTTTGMPPIPTVGAVIGERRRDRSETGRHPALQQNDEEGHFQNSGVQALLSLAVAAPIRKPTSAEAN